VKITFVPHLVPVNAGIATTTVAPLLAPVERVGELLQAAYGDSGFIRLLGLGGCPDTKNVARTNFLDIGWHHDPRTGRLLLLSAEDNLGKGAGGQAVQSFNLMFGLPARCGLEAV
jgi:N-acetyl-gamma-glutamyl-phosphate reductase